MHNEATTPALASGGITTVLVANRGEIARRVLRAARALGLRTVAVYGSADVDGAWLAEADVAVHIGDERDGLPYLGVDVLLAAAATTGADAIHPGYGFLAERADAAAAVVAAGLRWVGPPPEVMAAMGDKNAAKARAVAAGVPVVPGVGDGVSDGKQDLGALAARALVEVGLPCLVKAAAGGGGRGMRRVDVAADLPAALATAAEEAARAFGDGTVLVERFIARGRHIEVQILADGFGNVVHVGERDCSVQRRHQKLIEEAPAHGLDADVRAAICADAVRLAASIGYVSAGTVEFLVDAETGAHHFLEVNARIQVEHPVSEAVFGVDLVRWQLRIAAGEALDFKQSDLQPRGHAIEARLCAEDSTAGFSPQAGDVALFVVPALAGVRVDAGFDRSGGSVPVYFDSMVAKLVAHGETRAIARQRLMRALCDTRLFGVANNRAWLLAALRHADFIAGDVTTNWVDSGAVATATPSAFDDDDALVAAALWLHQDGLARRFRSNPSRADITVFVGPGDVVVHVAIERSGDDFAFAVERAADPLLQRPPSPGRVAAVVSRDDDGLRLKVDGVTRRFWLHSVGRSVGRSEDGSDADGNDDGGAVVWLQCAGVAGEVMAAVALREGTLLPTPQRRALPAGAVVAPSSAMVVEVHVAVGDHVAAGDKLVTVEAMKMLTPLCASEAGVVVAVAVVKGDSVRAGAALVEVRA